MLNIGNVQAHIINSLIQYNTEELDISRGKDYNQIRFSVMVNSIKDLIEYFHVYPKFYFQNKNKEDVFLAIGSIKKFTSLYDFECIEKIIDQNEFIKVVGAQRFQHEVCSKEWHGLEDCYYFIPQVTIERVSAMTVDIKINIPQEFETDEIIKKEYLFNLAHTLEHKSISYNEHNNYPISTSYLPQREDWKTMVEKALTNFNDLTKIVLSRKNITKYKKRICPTDIFQETQKNVDNSSYKIYFKLSPEQTFISFSPETLFKIKNNEIIVDSLAGTTTRGKNSHEDAILSQALISNPKELEEHRIVTDYIATKLKNFVQDVKISDIESVLKLKHIQHIHTKVSGHLKEKTKIFDVLSSFHPTPAVGGNPKELALELIKELEPFARGFYAAPMGYISKNSTELSVAIRSLLIHEDSLHIYGGCGIVKDSLPASEWVETRNKMKNFTNVMEKNFD